MSSRYWRLGGFGGIDLLRADTSTHRYARHSHEGYALGVVEAGAHAFTSRGQVWTATPGCVVIVNPDDAHDGGPAARDGDYSYRMMYVDGAVLTTALEEAAGRRVPTRFFPTPSSETRCSPAAFPNSIVPSSTRRRDSNVKPS